MMEWGKEQNTTKGNTTEYNTIQLKTKRMETGDDSESSGGKKQLHFKTLTMAIFYLHN